MPWLDEKGQRRFGSLARRRSRILFQSSTVKRGSVLHGDSPRYMASIDILLENTTKEERRLQSSDLLHCYCYWWGSGRRVTSFAPLSAGNLILVAQPFSSYQGHGSGMFQVTLTVLCESRPIVRKAEVWLVGAVVLGNVVRSLPALLQAMDALVEPNVRHASIHRGGK